MRTNVSTYTGVASRLRSDILAGRYPPGKRLPSERDLEAALGVSRVTIRRALRLLEEERLVQRRHGSGTYVSPKPTRRIPLMIDYTGTMHDHAPALNREVLLWRRESAGADTAERLDCDPTEQILYAERADKMDGLTVAWDQSYIAASFCQRLSDADLSRVDFIEAWTRRERFSIEECRQTIEAITAGKDVAHALNIARSKPVLRSTELYTTPHGRPAGLFISYYHPAHICISTRFRWADTIPAGRQPGRKP